MKSIFRNLTFLLFTLLCTVIFSSCIKMFDSKWWGENGWNGVDFGDATSAHLETFIDSPEKKVSHLYKITNLYRGGDYMITLTHANAYNNGSYVHPYEKNDVIITIAYDTSMTNVASQYDGCQPPIPFNIDEGPDDWDKSTIYVKVESKSNYMIEVDLILKILIRINGRGEFDPSPYSPVVTEL